MFISVELAAGFLLLAFVVSCESAVVTPYQCRDATNLTDGWRKDSSGRNYKPGGPHSSDGYVCDYHMKEHWFRFSKDAGTKMLDRCPKPYSCGTYIPIWTDSPMPQTVGQVAKVKAFQSFPFRGCKTNTNPILVMRCSERKDDFIYKNEVSYTDPCSYAFCGV